MQFSFGGNKNIDPLDSFGKNITDMALKNEIDPIIGRDDEIRRVIRILSRKTKNNPVLVGEPGVGKTAIVEGLAQKIISGQVPENLKDKEIIEIDMGSTMAGASFQGEFEKRIKNILKKVEDSKGEIILFIDEIHTLIGTGKNGQGGMDAAQILKPLLSRGKIRLIGATTLDEYRKYIEQDSAFERRMQKIIVDEPTKKEAITILRGIKERMESFHGVKIHDHALVAAVELSSRYISERFLPDKAIDLIDEAAAAIQTEINSKPEIIEKQEQILTMLKMEKSALKKEKDQKSLDRLAEIEKEISDSEKKYQKLKELWEKEKSQVKLLTSLKNKIEYNKTQLQRFQSEGEYEKASILMYKDIPVLEKKLSDLEKLIKTNEFSLIKEDVQEEEVAEIAAKWTHIPISRLLKSEKNKLLNLENNLKKNIKGQDHAIKLVSEAILRSKVDISDPNTPICSFIFMGPTGVGKTELVKSLAYELFDSKKNIVRIDMSEYMQEHSISRLIGSPPGYVGYESGGQLTEAVREKPYSIILFDEIEKAHPKVLDILLQVLDDGHLTDGRGKTVNFKNTIIILTTNIGSQDILDGKDLKTLPDLLHKYLRPEFINRIDETIVFNTLNKLDILNIAEKELGYLNQRLKDKNYEIIFDKLVLEKIVNEAYDPKFGARPINRYIKKYIEPIIAKGIMEEKILKDITYEFKVQNNDYILEKIQIN